MVYLSLKAYIDSGNDKNILFIIESPGELASAKPLMEEYSGNAYNVFVLSGKKISPQARIELAEYKVFSIENLVQNAAIDQFLGDQQTNFSKIISGLFHPSKYGQVLKRARNKQIPIIGIVDLSVPSTEKQPRLAQLFFSIAGKCDGIIVNNQSCQEKLLEEYQKAQAAGLISERNIINNEMLFVGPDPKWEYAKNKINSFNKNEIRQQLNIAEDEIVISFSSQPIPGNIEQGAVLQKIASAVKAIATKHPEKKINVLYLVHPRERTDYELPAEIKEKYLDFSEFKFAGLLVNFSAESDKIKIHKLDNMTYEALSISDVHITETSTTGTESYYAGIPTIFLTDQTHNLEVLEKKLVPQSTETNSIVSNILVVLDNAFQNLNSVDNNQIGSNLKEYLAIINSIDSTPPADNQRNKEEKDKRELSVKKQQLITLLNKYAVPGKIRGEIMTLFTQKKENFKEEDFLRISKYINKDFVAELKLLFN